MNRNCGCSGYAVKSKVTEFMEHITIAAEIRKNMTQEERIQADAQLEAFADVA